MTSDAVQINETVDRPQNIVGGNMVLNPKVVKQTLLHHHPLAYHRSNPRLNLKAVNQLRAEAATTSFSTISAHSRQSVLGASGGELTSAGAWNWRCRQGKRPLAPWAQCAELLLNHNPAKQ